MAKLRPRARLIRAIGDRLISGPEAAIIELVKNAYDADSSKVLIKIFPPKSDFLGRIVVQDFGHGMTQENILNNWLEPATDTKNVNKRSRSGSRSVLGAKGVGRFASASLGEITRVVSIATSGQVVEKSEINVKWDDFLKTKYLDEVELDISTKIIPENVNTGVTIEIENLLHVWDEKKISKLIKELRKLARPSDKSDAFDIYLDLDEFHQGLPYPYNFNGAELLKRKNSDYTNPLESRNSSKILPFATNSECDYKLTGEFTHWGDFNGTFTIERGDKLPISVSIPALPLDSTELPCGKIQIELRVYDLEKDSIENLFSRMHLKFEDFGLRNARNFLAENTGVAIYRSGFRIRPYGEPDNDWLSLEKRRVQQPSKRIGHGQISGAVIVSNEEDSNLIERSSREGLENNGAFERLTRLITNVLIVIEQKRVDFRKAAGISRKPEASIEKARDIAKFDQIIKSISNLSTELQKPLLLKIEEESRALTKALDDIEAYQRLLQSRAALGMVVAQLLHDGRTYLEPIRYYSKQIKDSSNFLTDTGVKGELTRKNVPIYANDIIESADGISQLFKSLDPISGRKRGAPKNNSVKEIANICFNLLENKMHEFNINSSINVGVDILYFGYKGDLQAALLNIISNAIHWLSTVSIENKYINLSATVDNYQVDILISNNGPEISEDNISNIFDAGFSLKSDGHGLGLSIAREAIRSSHGELMLFSTNPETTFKIILPQEVKNEY
ncbi:sensor histidine kinase [Rheinheimera baltica]|uniref:histidine kinase n=1 Tax=Rheinheimera baltica TaxID=67576 RepID=A0ABT9I4M6_9GAMM|nr:sensor histidine kinase [Rheinheimera baltica]MDP5137896.1 sensor histidine kinase [Rheinheimera baltica]MDP5150978.1 sensor histidine kinase [Rheinheimera baltica]